MNQSSAVKTGTKLQLSGFVLKWIAIITMLIDHIAAVVIEGRIDFINSHPDLYLRSNYFTLWTVYGVMRSIGRMAFPIFCFLIVEGFLHTRSVGKYALRLGIFALISEIPFDLAFRNSFTDFQYNNVFLTLLIGLLVLIGLKAVEKRFFGENISMPKRCLGIFFMADIICLGMLIAECLYTDYGAAGVAAIALLYVLRNYRMVAFGAAVVSLAVLSDPVELWALLMLIPVHFYDGTRGREMKYFFYIFYPAHLLILTLICYGMGLR